MTLTPHARRVALLGVALSATLASAGWLFFGTHESSDAAAAAPAAAAATAAKPAPDTLRVVQAAPAPEIAAAPVAKSAAPSTATIEREEFAYGGRGRRDPFRPLITTNELRPLPNELRLVAVVFDPHGDGSVAILRDHTTKKQHRVRAGQLLGRMRVAQIRQKHVVFTIEELGFSRQETLGLQDSTATRLP